MSFIQIKDLTLNIKKRKLLDNISLCVESGERVALVGANGAGKTTLLRCLLGLLPYNKGTIQLDNTPLPSLSRKDLAQAISYVPQQLSTSIPYTVIEFVTMSRYAHAQGIIPQDHEGYQIARKTMEKTKILHLENQVMSTLSGGELQKVNLTAALCQSTPILLLDEPANHLDPAQQVSIQKILSGVDATSITVTHDLHWAASDFDRIIGMSEGKIILDAAPAKFMTSENLHLIFGGTWDIFPHPKTGAPIILPVATSSGRLATPHSAPSPQ